MFHSSTVTPAAVVQRRQKPQCSVRRRYRLDEVAAFITGGLSSTSSSAVSSFHRVALQFPDDLLEDSIAVMETLKEILASNKTHNGKNKEETSADPDKEGKECHHKEEDTEKGIRLFVVADNTFGSCCPDEITAQHYNSDCIIHFGDACMSRSTRIPVYYVQDDFHFTALSYHHPPPPPPHNNNNNNNNNKEKWDNLSVKIVVQAVALLQKRLHTLSLSLKEEHIPSRVVLVVVGTHRSRSLVENAARQWRNEQEKISTLHPSSSIGEDEVLIEWCKFEPTNCEEEKEQQQSFEKESTWVMNGVRFSRTDANTLQQFLFIGPSNSVLPIHLLNVQQYNLFHHPEALRDVAFDSNVYEQLTILDESFPQNDELDFSNLKIDSAALETVLEKYFSQSANTLRVHQTALNKRMRQRAFNVELIRSCSAVGIVVASLAIEGYYEVTMLLHKLLRAYGKRSYIIYIGHLNKYKIANFVDTVDCFVSIACQNSREGYFPSKEDEFSKPIVSPIEVLLALRTEDGDSPLFGHHAVYSTTFDAVLPLLREAVESVDKERAETKSSTVHMPGGADGSGAALIRATAGTLAIAGANGALVRLHERSFVGLDPQVGQTPVQAAIVEGRHGIARGYASERSRQQGEDGGEEDKGKEE
ncbi:putative diphthamide synthesis protein [Trypanosoma theileri]|uniref:Putative diphthamide synthesis protein n=1 Tax=Trypanosoma theileri TaxID=67003 RepID=A0A1X0P3T2_9TRYP|nr:putative diphthamide synthesis protein [Trypanosoma theileri]ORC91584.1 putative diphthamide synthesis protein [Trypanosoma theileri]